MIAEDAMESSDTESIADEIPITTGDLKSLTQQRVWAIGSDRIILRLQT